MQLQPLDSAMASMSVAGARPLPHLPAAPDGEVSFGAFLAAPTPVAARFRRERGWLAALPGIDGEIANLLAGHAAGCMASMRPREASAADFAGRFGPVFSILAAALPNRADLEAALGFFGANAGQAQSRETMFAMAEALWPLAAPTEYLLASGGDDRLTLDPQTGLNKYGCAPWPRPDVISYGSCTASSLSEGAFEAAEAARRALLTASLATSPATALAEASESIATALLHHFGVADLAEAVLAASGTDAALVVTGLLAAERPGQTLTSVLVSPSETGSGVPDAVQGRHFASCAPSGSAVFKGQPIDGLPAGPRLVTVALRDAAGAPRPAADIESACESAIRAGIADGRVVLHAMDGSKTGLSAPDRAACRRLADVYGERLDIVIDACQARIEPALIRWYLEQGFPVLITGSKFFAAPGFCGAVLFPRKRLNNIARAGRLPAGLAAYARLQGGFGSRRCPGLVLRWTAALYEMAAFSVLPVEEVRARLDRIGQSIEAALGAEDRFHLIPAPRPSGMGWSDRRSVFTFAIKNAAGWLHSAQLRVLYQALGEAGPDGAPKCQIGQPVELGTSGLAGLRLAASAAQLVADDDHAPRLSVVVGKVRALLDAQELTPPAA